MTEVKSTLTVELLKNIITGIAGAAILFISQQWANSDLEYKRAKRDAYISSPIGEQGLSLSYDGREIKNISIVEFGIFNKTEHNLNDVNLIFTYNNPENKFKLLSGTIIPPNGFPQKDIVEETQTKERNTKGFLIKAIQKQQDDEYYHAVFIFEGDTAPSMSVTSTTKAATIVPYREWKDTTIAISAIVGILALMVSIMFIIATLVDFFFAEKNHNKIVRRFELHAKKLQNEGKISLHSKNPIEDAIEIYKSFTSPKPSKFWIKIFKGKSSQVEA